jgi:hypothetical protein
MQLGGALVNFMLEMLPTLIEFLIVLFNSLPHVTEFGYQDLEVGFCGRDGGVAVFVPVAKLSGPLVDLLQSDIQLGQRTLHS